MINNNLFAASAQTFLHSFLTNMTSCSADDLARLNEQLTSTFAPEFPSWSSQNDHERPASVKNQAPQSSDSAKPTDSKSKEAKESEAAMTAIKQASTKAGCSHKMSTSYYFVKRKFIMSQVKVFIYISLVSLLCTEFFL